MLLYTVYMCSSVPVGQPSGNANQRWLLDDQGRLRPHSNPTLCLDTAWNEWAVGRKMRLWTCFDNDSAMRWMAPMTAVGPGFWSGESFGITGAGGNSGWCVYAPSFSAGGQVSQS